MLLACRVERTEQVISFKLLPEEIGSLQQPLQNLFQRLSFHCIEQRRKRKRKGRLRKGKGSGLVFWRASIASGEQTFTKLTFSVRKLRGSILSFSSCEGSQFRRAPTYDLFLLTLGMLMQVSEKAEEKSEAWSWAVWSLCSTIASTMLITSDLTLRWDFVEFLYL